jgi:hypothetical protein
VASVANILLRAMGEQVPVNGAREVDMVRAAIPQDEDFGFSDPDYQPLETPRTQFTVIFRKKVTLIEDAIAFSLAHPNHKLHLRIQRIFPKSTFDKFLRLQFELSARRSSGMPLISPSTCSTCSTAASLLTKSSTYRDPVAHLIQGCVTGATGGVGPVLMDGPSVHADTSIPPFAFKGR